MEATAILNISEKGSYALFPLVVGNLPASPYATPSAAQSRANMMWPSGQIQ
jgi:hypothetical protein